MTAARRDVEVKDTFGTVGGGRFEFGCSEAAWAQ
jgi:hypothetical protein